MENQINSIGNWLMATFLLFGVTLYSFSITIAGSDAIMALILFFLATCFIVGSAIVENSMLKR